jgi:hypothetical protein
MTYQRLLEIYAEEAGLRKRVIIPVPVLTPTLSALWINLISPVPKAIALPLTEGLTSDAVCRDHRIRGIIPQQLLSCREAIRRSLERVKQEQLETCWSPDGKLLPFEWPYCGDADYAGGTRYVCAYRAEAAATAEDIWHSLSRIGGRHGYYYADVLWRLRGLIDRLLGGKGIDAGRTRNIGFRPGDAFDFWRVLQADPPQRLHLLSEMKMPGDALLDINLMPLGRNRCEIQLIARFLPKGLGGILYWNVFLPVHHILFRGMIEAIVRSAGKQLMNGPDPFTPEMKNVCFLPRYQ